MKEELVGHLLSTRAFGSPELGAESHTGIQVKEMESTWREKSKRATGDSTRALNCRKTGRLGPKLLVWWSWSWGRGERRSRNWRGNGSERKMKQ